jgi:asparagine synthase (glutamine-hydrolysing)
MVGAVPFRGVDGVAYWNAGPLALAHMQFFTTPESLEERQPLVSSGGEACLVWNGRVDNREELKAGLEAVGARLEDETDPGLVLAAYLEWGTGCVQRIVGDFALAVWDARARKLWCARDYVGVRPFYYFWDGKSFSFGPDVRAMLAYPLVSLKINEGMVGEFLVDEVTSREETLYADIRQLPPGCTLTVDGDKGLRIEEWWSPELSLLTYESDDEYAEQFRRLMDQSVRSRMRCNTPWAAELSGGLDSSSIAVSARAVLDESGRGEDRILTFSMASPGKPWDESDDIAAVREKARLTSELLEPLRASLDFFGERAGYWRDYPGSPNGEPMTLPIYEAAKRHGVRVLFSGVGGDELFDSRDGHLLDLAAGIWRPGALRRLTDTARCDWTAKGGARNWQRLLAKRLIIGYMPKRARVLRERRWLRKCTAVSPGFARRIRLAERILAPVRPMPQLFATRAQRDVYRNVVCGLEALVLALNDRETAHLGIEKRFPFLDRRLVEFCLRLPEEQRRRGEITKYLLRRAMDRRLAERVQRKVGKAEFSELFDVVFSTEQGRNRMESPMMQSNTDWIDAEKLRSFLLAGGGIWRRWTLVAIDLWLEQTTRSAG